MPPTNNFFHILSRSWLMPVEAGLDNPATQPAQLAMQVFYTYHAQSCQNEPAAGNFATFSPFLAAYSTSDFTRSPLAGKGTWCLLPTTPDMLPDAMKHLCMLMDCIKGKLNGDVKLIFFSNCPMKITALKNMPC